MPSLKPKFSLSSALLRSGSTAINARPVPWVRASAAASMRARSAGVTASPASALAKRSCTSRWAPAGSKRSRPLTWGASAQCAGWLCRTSPSRPARAAMPSLKACGKRSSRPCGTPRAVRPASVSATWVQTPCSGPAAGGCWPWAVTGAVDSQARAWLGWLMRISSSAPRLAGSLVSRPACRSASASGSSRAWTGGACRLPSNHSSIA
mmetsp:Transcript_68813/g.161920  ORF Transcript_68813/g.161920 Transcript_68813/m.161920 type:complete len:208 (+) Transcript_68813:162-785(+)